ncbi:hypothetical protein ACFYXQ_04270 [Nocardia jiangxiensis]|uniref:Uncharacterized protein n=1 Tax=Nocardia jiangxiensis TaxID=282685 RepID=A0ABW6RSJ9_9NOCA
MALPRYLVSFVLPLPVHSIPESQFWNALRPNASPPYSSFLEDAFWNALIGNPNYGG